MSCGKRSAGSDSTSAVLITALGAFLSWSWYRIINDENCQRANNKRRVIDKARTILQRLDNINVSFCHNSVYGFVQHKINAALRAMDNNDNDRAREYFVEVLLLTGRNKEIVDLMVSQLPEDMVNKIRRSIRLPTNS